MTAAQSLYEQMVSENERATMGGQGERITAESRCVRSIIHSIIEPMVKQLGS